MNLDELKESWKLYSDGIAKSHINEEEITRLLKNKAQDAINKMTRNLMVEFVFTVLMYLFILVYFFTKSNKDHWSFVLVVSIVSFVFLTSSVFMVIKYIQLIRESFQADSLLNTLKRKVKIITSFITVYKLSGFTLYVLGVISALLYNYEISHGIIFPLIGFLLSLIIGYYAIIPMLRWYVNKIYGIYLTQLKSCLNELEHE